HATFESGDVSHQGDLIIVCIGALPKSARPRKDRQLAEGSTQGSRHVLQRGDLYDAEAGEVADLIRAATTCTVAPLYLGPVFVSPANPTADDLTHPEHGAQGFPAGCVCGGLSTEFGSGRAGTKDSGLIDMSATIPMIGRTFGRLTVLSAAEPSKTTRRSKPQWA